MFASSVAGGALGRGGVSSLTTQIRSLQLGCDVAGCAVQPSCDRVAPNEQVCFAGEHAEDVLADIACQLEIACPAQGRTGYQALVSPDQFGERVLRMLLTPALQKTGIALVGYVGMHSPP